MSDVFEQARRSLAHLDFQGDCLKKKKNGREHEYAKYANEVCA